jgi:hypothetical protein
LATAERAVTAACQFTALCPLGCAHAVCAGEREEEEEEEGKERRQRKTKWRKK